MATRIGVVRFPGSNCEFDAVEAVESFGGEAEMIWHDDPSLPAVDAVILPGGFAHGDYLRTGAIARFSPVMKAIGAFAEEGGPVVGICNGFQILTESGMLPGALQKNSGLKFLCTDALLRVESTRSPLSSNLLPGQELVIPINHFEGNYTCSPAVLDELRAEQRIIFTYVDNPNGSIGDIAGICNVARNVVGLMPHPERACHPLLGRTDGVGIIQSLLATAGLSPARG